MTNVASHTLIDSELKYRTHKLISNAKIFPVSSDVYITNTNTSMICITSIYNVVTHQINSHQFFRVFEYMLYTLWLKIGFEEVMNYNEPKLNVTYKLNMHLG